MYVYFSQLKNMIDLFNIIIFYFIFNYEDIKKKWVYEVIKEGVVSVFFKCSNDGFIWHPMKYKGIILINKKQLIYNNNNYYMYN